MSTNTWGYHAPTGLLTANTDAAGRTVSHTYTQAGQPYQRTWARGVVTTYAYSGATGELTSITYSDGTPSVSFTYNRLGKTATVADATGTRTFTYNLTGTLELQNEILASGYFGDRRVTRGYDTTSSGTLGRYNRLGVGPSGAPYSEIDQPYGFDTYGRFNSIGYTAHTYTYQTNSHLIASIAHTSSGWTQTRTYLSNADIVDVIDTKFGATTKARFDYTHDNLYRVITAAKTGEMFSTYGNGTQGLETDYAYDDKSQLTADSTTLGGSSTPLTGRDDYHAYDPIGNRTQVNRSGSTITYNANNLNQYTSFTGSATHTYDDDGNLTNDGTWSYTWDAENRLAAQETLSGVTPQRRLEFAYDYLGRRVRKIVKDWGGGAWITSTDLKIIHDGHNALLELNALNSLAKVRAHIWGLDLSNTLHGAGGVGGLLYTHDYTTSTTYMPAYDGNGNILNYVNASTGAITQKYEYDAFGQTIVSAGSAAAATPFRFATKYTDTETGLVNFGYRLYGPSLGRFPNRDPIAEDGGLNLYAYCTNDAVNHYDYLGMMKRWHDGGGWTGGAGQGFLGGATDGDHIQWVQVGGLLGSLAVEQQAEAARQIARGNNSSGLSPNSGAVIAVKEADGTQSIYVHEPGEGTSLARDNAGYTIGGDQSVVSAVGIGGGSIMVTVTAGAVPLGRTGNGAISGLEYQTSLGGWASWATPDWVPSVRGNHTDISEANIRAGSENSARGGPDVWGALHAAAGQTFGIAAFQQPLTTLGTAAVQTTALVGASYAVGTAAIAAAPITVGAVEAFIALPPSAKAFIVAGAVRLAVGAGGEHTATNQAARRVLANRLAAEAAARTTKQAAKAAGSTPVPPFVP